MPVTDTTVLHIVCDNPDCKGNDLPVDDRVGWLFVSHEVYGEPSAQHVFCSYECLSEASKKVSVDPTAMPFGNEEVPVEAPVEVPSVEAAPA